MLVFSENDFHCLSNFLQTHIFWKFGHISRSYNEINYRNIWIAKVIIILTMTAQVLFFSTFFPKKARTLIPLSLKVTIFQHVLLVTIFPLTFPQSFLHKINVPKISLILIKPKNQKDFKKQEFRSHISPKSYVKTQNYRGSFEKLAVFIYVWLWFWNFQETSTVREEVNTKL